MKKIMVIDDDIDLLEIIKLFLEDCGFKVLDSPNRVPLFKIVQDKPNLILLDYFLDDGYGKEICLEIKANQLTNHIPVVLMSASNYIEKFAMESDADAFMCKPFDIDKLEELINELAL